MIHKPVLKKEVLEMLDIKPSENFIDATVGESGHTLGILERNGPDGRVLGIDLDEAQVKNSVTETQKFKDRIILENDSYANLKEIVDKYNFGPVDGILLDLGYSFWQMEVSEKGFSFKRDQILDMRYNLQSSLTAEEIVNEYSKEDIEIILENYGEEKFAKQIAKQIVQERKSKRIKSTFELVGVVKKAMPARFRHEKIHFATRTFQAIRIAVNDELNNLIKVLPDAVAILAKGARLAIISFHSLEDRIVKNFYNEKEDQKIIKIINKKPIIASREEISLNHRARSAKLRVAEKI